jgi:hypothetical protein
VTVIDDLEGGRIHVGHEAHQVLVGQPVQVA